MNEFNLPSDNLHKFVAFSGLALVVAAVVLSANLLVDLVERVNVLNVAIGEVDMELKWHTAKAGRGSDEVKTVPLTELPLDLAKAGGRLSAQRKAIEDLVQMESYVLLAASVTILVGMFFFFAGIKAWRAQQKKHDLLLDHEVQAIGVGRAAV